MEDEYRLSEFKREYIENFAIVQKKVSEIPYVNDSIEYLLTLIYGFENYLVDEIATRDKTGLILRRIENNASGGGNVFTLLEQIKEYEEYLTLKERIFVLKIKNLAELQLRKMKLHTAFPNALVRNKFNNLIAEHDENNEENKQDRLIWLGEKDEAVRLVNELKKLGFIDDIETDKIMSLFCRQNGELLSNENQIKVKWRKNISELAYLFRSMIDAGNKRISSKEIWVKVSKCFTDKNGQKLNPSSLAVSSQKGNPKSKSLIDAMLKGISKRIN